MNENGKEWEEERRGREQMIGWEEEEMGGREGRGGKMIEGQKEDRSEEYSIR